MGNLVERMDGWTDGRMDGRTDKVGGEARSTLLEISFQSTQTHMIFSRTKQYRTTLGTGIEVLRRFDRSRVAKATCTQLNPAITNVKRPANYVC